MILYFIIFMIDLDAFGGASLAIVFCHCAGLEKALSQTWHPVGTKRYQSVTRTGSWLKFLRSIKVKRDHH
jgi:hypothetical protein